MKRFIKHSPLCRNLLIISGGAAMAVVTIAYGWLVSKLFNVFSDQLSMIALVAVTTLGWSIYFKIKVSGGETSDGD